MNKYKVQIPCQYFEEYYVDAENEVEALQLVKDGMVECSGEQAGKADKVYITQLNNIGADRAEKALEDIKRIQEINRKLKKLGVSK